MGIVTNTNSDDDEGYGDPPLVKSIGLKYSAHGRMEHSTFRFLKEYIVFFFLLTPFACW